MITIPSHLATAQSARIRTPIVQVIIFRPGYPPYYPAGAAGYYDPAATNFLDASRYVKSFNLSEPPDLAPATLTLELVNPGNVLSDSVYMRQDYVVRISLGFMVNGIPQYVQRGVFYIDQPQRDFSTSPPQNVIHLQCRCGFKVLQETRFVAESWITIDNMPMQSAVTAALSYGPLAGVPFATVFDTDAATAAALARPVLEITGGAQDQINSAYELLREVLSVEGLRAFFNGEGKLRVGLMNQTTQVAGTVGGDLARPIFRRNHQRSGREQYNWVHVEGDLVYADASDPANITDIGRTKYLYIDDPEIDTITRAEARALQELDLASRFRDQPDMEMPWQLDLERGDLVLVDDAQTSGLPLGIYRIEDLRFTFTNGGTPQATMQIGLGWPSADASLSSSQYAYFGSTTTAQQYATQSVVQIPAGTT